MQLTEPSKSVKCDELIININFCQILFHSLQWTEVVTKNYTARHKGISIMCFYKCSTVMQKNHLKGCRMSDFSRNRRNWIVAALMLHWLQMPGQLHLLKRMYLNDQCGCVPLNIWWWMVFCYSMMSTTYPAFLASKSCQMMFRVLIFLARRRNLQSSLWFTATV